ncbi:hypothetical protein TruAng_001819 [Truncatella angustata]|nr:hypothetical protein TruAng_001819 [Truncatella angustata]
MSLIRGCPQPPTSSLPPLRSLDALTEEDILASLHNLRALYCPLSSALTFYGEKSKSDSPLSKPHTQPVDSGYVSGDEGGSANEDDEDVLDSLRADGFERNYALRWLTGFIARSEGLSIWSSEDECERAVDQASYVLASFSSTVEQDADEKDSGITRNFQFDVGPMLFTSTDVPAKVEVKLMDKPIGTGNDHTDVGLQSWGASIVFSDLICAKPERFDITKLSDSPRVIELGAGTGLVGLTLAKLLPYLGYSNADVVATDYHSAVLANLQDNVKANFQEMVPPPLQTCVLDWSAPTFEAPLDRLADLIVATDVIYAPEHAIWIRDCVGHYLKPNGVFWLMATVRQNGKFEGISDTVASAFGNVDYLPRDNMGRKLRILEEERIQKRSGIGRGDETGYDLFKIGWSEA